jgi:hypothetical protein
MCCQWRETKNWINGRVKTTCTNGRAHILTYICAYYCTIGRKVTTIATQCFYSHIFHPLSVTTFIESLLYAVSFHLSHCPPHFTSIFSHHPCILSLLMPSASHSYSHSGITVVAPDMSSARRRPHRSPFPFLLISLFMLQMGFLVGLRVGFFVGILVGDLVGALVGALVGWFVGVFVGVFVGLFVGVFVGLFVGVLVGWFVGVFVVGLWVGALLGIELGWYDGDWLGKELGWCDGDGDWLGMVDGDGDWLGMVDGDELGGVGGQSSE